MSSYRLYNSLGGYYSESNPNSLWANGIDLPNSVKTLRMIPYSAKVRDSGHEPKPRSDDESKPTPGFFEATSEEFKQNSLLMAVWRWGNLKIARHFGERAPNGWNPKDHINGFFEDYADYLCEAENPGELELRKNYVIQRINYERMVAQLGTGTRILSSLAGNVIDPITWILMAGTGGAGAARIGAMAARAGMSRVGAAMMTGAVTGVVVDTMDVGFKRGLRGSQVVKPEYHPIANMLFGSALGGVGGVLSDSAAFAKFKLEHGSGDFALYRASEKEARKLINGAYEDLSNIERVERLQMVDKQVQQYINGTLDSTNLRTFDISAAVDKEREIGASLGVFGIVGRKGEEVLASGLNRLRGVFSNHMRLLNNDLPSMRLAGMKIFPTVTYERNILTKLGNQEPLVTKVARANSKAQQQICESLKVGYKLAKEVGFEGTKADFQREIFDALQDPAIRGAIENEGIRYTVDKFDEVNRRAAEWLYKNDGFEFQKKCNEDFNQAKQELIDFGVKEHKEWGIEPGHIEGTQTLDLKKLPENARESFERLQLDYKTLERVHKENMSGGLDKALERFGGTYFPRELDGLKIQANLDTAKRLIHDSMLHGEQQHNRDRLEQVWDRVLSDIDFKKEKINTVAKFWKRCNKLLGGYGLKDVFKCPVVDGLEVMKPTVTKAGKVGKPKKILDVQALRPDMLEFSEGFYDDVKARAAERIRYAIDKAYSPISGARGAVNFSERLKRSAEDPELKPHGSARHRHYIDNYEEVRPFLKDDLVDLEDRYIKNMHSSAGMIECFGDENGERFVDNVFKEYQEELDRIARETQARPGAVDAEKDRAFQVTSKSRHLMNNLKAGLRSLEAAINHVKGYGSITWDEMDKAAPFARVCSVMSNWNIARYLSDCVFSQFQDQANVALHLNGWKTFGESLVNAARFLGNKDLQREYKELITDLGISSDLWIKSQRAQELVSLSDRVGFLGNVEYGFEKLANTALTLSGSKYLDAWTQANASYMAGGELSRCCQAYASHQKLTAFQTDFLAGTKLNFNEILGIAEELRAHGSVTNGVRSLNLGKWDNQGLADKVREILYKHGVGATMVPGAELPPIFRSPIGKLFFQFRSFATATYNKMFMYSLEKGTTQAANTIVQCMLMDAFGKICKAVPSGWFEKTGKDPVTGKNRKFNAFDVAMRAFDDSLTDNDWASWMMDPFGIIQGIAHPDSSAYQFGGVMGGLKRDISSGSTMLLRLASGEKVPERYARSFMRLFPFQNFFGIRAGLSGVRRLKENIKKVRESK